MKFSPVSPTEAYQVRFISESGRWELGLRQMLFGVRVSANLVGDDACTLDYCAGAETERIFFLLGLVSTILEGQPETLTPAQLRAFLPGYERRPIHHDQTCMDELVRLAHEAQRRVAV